MATPSYEDILGALDAEPQRQDQGSPDDYGGLRERSQPLGPETAFGEWLRKQSVFPSLSSSDMDLYSSADRQASPEWGAQFLASMKASPEGRLNFLRKRYGDAVVHPLYDKRTGDLFNVLIERPGQRPMLLNKPGIDFGDIPFGDALEAGIGMAGSVLAGKKNPILGAATEPAADALGSVVRQGVSAAIPGEDELSPQQRATMVGVNVAGGLIGKVAGKAGAGAMRLGERAASRALGATGNEAMQREAAAATLADRMAPEMRERSVASIAPETVRDRWARSKQLEREMSDELGQTFRFDVAQATGSKAALAEMRVAGQVPSLADSMAIQQARRLEMTADFADSITRAVARQPDSLGDADVGAQVAEAFDRHSRNLISARSEATRPLYEIAESAADGGTVIPTDAVTGELGALIEAHQFAPAQMSSRMREVLGKINKASATRGGPTAVEIQDMRGFWDAVARGDVAPIVGVENSDQRRIASRVLDVIDQDLTRPDARSELGALIKAYRFDPTPMSSRMLATMGKLNESGAPGGRITVRDMQNLRSFWVAVARGDETPIEGVEKAAQRRIASRILDAIDKDLTTAEQSISGREAATALRAANARWREMSEPINELSTKAIKRILRLGADDAPEAIVSRMSSLSRDQLRSVLGILDKVDPAAAANLRAQRLANIFSEGGVGQSNTEFARELSAGVGESRVRPNALRDAIRERADEIGTIFANDPATRKKVVILAEVADRLGSTAGTQGSPTFQNALVAGVLDAARRGGRGLFEAATKAAQDAMTSRFASREALAKMLTDPEAVDQLYLMAQASMAKPQSISQQAARRAIEALSRLTTLSQRSETLEPAPPSRSNEPSRVTADDLEPQP